MIAQSGIDALFFTRYGIDQLPTMYLILGPTMFAVMLAVGVLLARVGRGRAFVAIPLAISLAAVAGRAAVETEADWVFGALWVAREVAEMLSVLTVWGLAGLVTDTRQAKRFFPLIAAGGVFGLITGGFATRPLAGALGPENLIAVWAAAVACVAILSWTLVARAGARAHVPRVRRRRRAGNVVGFVRRSPLLSWLAIGSLLTSTLFSLLYFGFSGAAVERYPDENDLAGFFGTFFALATGTAFVLSLVVTSRLLRRFGVPTLILVLPLVYAAAFGVLTIAATFAAFTFFRFVQVAWYGGGGSSAWEALVNAVPASRRDQVRALL
jgi:ATP/ADP translocase